MTSKLYKEAQRALKGLFIVAPEDVAQDICDKVNAYIDEGRKENEQHCHMIKRLSKILEELQVYSCLDKTDVADLDMINKVNDILDTVKGVSNKEHEEVDEISPVC